MMLFAIQILLRAIDLYSIILILYALLSWFPGAYNTLFGRLIAYMVEPILKPLQGLRLQAFGLDFTLVLLLFVCQLLTRILSYIAIFLLW